MHTRKAVCGSATMGSIKKRGRITIKKLDWIRQMRGFVMPATRPATPIMHGLLAVNLGVVNLALDAKWVVMVAQTAAQHPGVSIEQHGIE